MGLLKKIATKLSLSIMENEECRNHSRMTLKHLLMRSPWALQMADSSSKFPSGVLMGNVVDFGNYEECLKVNVKEDWGSFVGQHCMLQLPIKAEKFDITYKNGSNALRYIWSMCIPSSCTPEDLSTLFSAVVRKPVTVDPLTCHTNSTTPLQTIDWFAIAVFIVFGLLCVLSTIYDIAVPDKGHRKNVLTAFSWYTNGKRLLSTETSEDTMTCLDGIRFISILWIVLGHVYLLTIFEPTVNIVDAYNEIRDWNHSIIISGIYAVDTFLLLSGLLLTYIFLKTMSKEVRFNLIAFYFHRYIRLTPMVALIVLINTGLFKHFASGPMWELCMSKIQTPCYENWWTSLLFIHNYVNPQKMCVGETWYLAVDMQLYLLSPLLLFPLLKRPRVGFILVQIVTVASTFSCFLSSYLEGNDDPLRHFRNAEIPNSYMQTHVRATPWLVGVTLGYIFHRNHQCRKDISIGIRHGYSKLQNSQMVVLGWMFATVCLLLPIIIKHRMVQLDANLNIFVEAFELTASRLLWSLGLSWVIYACHTGCGGVVNTFLSWKFFRPLSRLSFCMYLLHLTTIVVVVFSTRTPVYFSDGNKISQFFSQTMITIFLASIATLMFEIPLIILGNILLQKVSGNRSGRTKRY